MRFCGNFWQSTESTIMEIHRVPSIGENFSHHIKIKRFTSLYSTLIFRWKNVKRQADHRQILRRFWDTLNVNSFQTVCTTLQTRSLGR